MLPTGTAMLGVVAYDSLNRPIAVSQRPRVYWVSGNPGVASVELNSGRVTARKVGYATIYAVISQTLYASARACVVPKTGINLNAVIAGKPVVGFARNLGAPPSMRVGDTVQATLRLAYKADDTTARNIDSWGPCVHYVLNGGPAYPRIPLASEVVVTRDGTVFVKCCIHQIYLSATVGLAPPVATVYYNRPGATPAIRIAEVPLPDPWVQARKAAR